MRAMRACGLAAAVGMLAFVSHARAADFEEPAVNDWTQFHIGIGGGYGFVNHEIDVNADGLGIDFSGLGGEGWLGTIEAGFDWQISDMFLIGVGADYTRSSISTDLNLNIGGGPSIDAEIEASDSLTVLGRAGLLTNETLWYGLVGWTRTWWQTDISAVSGNFDFDLDGITFGGGVEQRFWDGNVSVKLEYRYTSYETLDVIDLIDVDAPGVSADDDPNVQTIRGIVSWRFL